MSERPERPGDVFFLQQRIESLEAELAQLREQLERAEGERDKQAQLGDCLRVANANLRDERDSLRATAEGLAEAIEPLMGKMNFYFGPGARTLVSQESVEGWRRVKGALVAYRNLESGKQADERKER